MSVSSVGSGSLPEPGSYTYTPSLPTGLSGGSAPSSVSSGTSSTTSSTSSSSTTSATSAATGTTISPYVAEYNSLQSYDAAELIQVSLDSPTAASSNVEGVLAQAAALQSQQTAAGNAALASAANADIQGTSSSSSTTSANDPLSDIPSYESIVSQSDTDADDALNASLGINTTGTSSSLGAGSSTSASTSTSSDNPLNIPSYEQVINGTGGSLGSSIDTTA